VAYNNAGRHFALDKVNLTSSEAVRPYLTKDNIKRTKEFGFRIVTRTLERIYTSAFEVDTEITTLSDPLLLCHRV
jgi:hypothetical protein